MADNSDKKVLNDNQSLALILKLIPVVQKQIVCDYMRYLYTKEFKDKATGIVTSSYHVFGAHNLNNKAGDMQKITYHEESGLIEFQLHPIQNHINLPFLYPNVL